VGQGAVQKLSQNYSLKVTWMPYYLRPDTPPEGMELPAQLAEQFTRGNELQERIRENLKGIGYEF
jgi:predicted DsbA family dithiol-disulfide isomerase